MAWWIALAGDWHCPACAKKKPTSSSLSAAPQASNKKKATAYQNEPDSEDDDLFMPQKRAVATASGGKGKTSPCKTPRDLTAVSTQTPADHKRCQTKGVSSKGKSKASAKKASAQSTKAVAEKGRASKEAAASEDDDFQSGKKNHSTKPRMQDEAPKDPPAKRRKTLPAAAKALLGMFEKDMALEEQMERALELEKEARRGHDEGAAVQVSEDEGRLRSCLDDDGGSPRQLSAPLTQEKAKPGKMSSDAWLKDLTRRKSQRAKQDDADSSDSDMEQVDNHMQDCYFPNKVYLQGILKDSNFDVKAFLNRRQAKATRQDGLDEMMMREQVGRRPLEKEKKELDKVVKCMLKEFPQYVQPEDDAEDLPVP